MYPGNTGRELTAQEINNQIIKEVIGSKKNQGISDEEQRILDQLDQWPMHPFKMSNMKWRKCKKIKDEFDKMKRKLLTGEEIDEDRPKHGFDLEKAAEEYLNSDKVDAFPLHGDITKGNLNEMLRNAILRSEYFKIDLYEKRTYHEVINEIDIHVGYVEPWTLGTHGVPSTLFCCLYKLMLMRLTMKQLFGLIKESNPYTRWVGFLYIRYLCKPELLWHFLSPYMMDDQEFIPTPSTGETITVGEFVEKLLADQTFYTTIMPRIPAQIDKEIQK